MYNHKTINLPEIKATTTDGVRLYETPEGNKYPSITTVLSVRNKKGLFEWRKRVGEDVANYVARKAANRGTAVHHMCEDYLNNDFDEEKHKKKFLPYVLFNHLKESVLQKVDNIYDRLKTVLENFDCDVGASEAHGILFGLITGPKAYEESVWFSCLAESEDVFRDSLEVDSAKFLSLLADISIEILRAGSGVFLLLPRPPLPFPGYYQMAGY